MNHQQVTFTYKSQCCLKLRAIGVFAAGFISKGSIEDQTVELPCIILVC
jgi:hypothetical protein